MPRKLPPFVLRETTRHGKTVFYFRRGKGARIRLPDITHADFKKAYAAALSGNAVPRPTDGRTARPETFRWLILRYKESAFWSRLSPATRYQRDRIFVQVISKSGDEPFLAIDRLTIQRAMDRRAATPAQANVFLKAMRGLFDWAVRNEHVVINPCDGVDRLKDKTDGFPAWTVDDVAAFRAKHEIGMRPRLAMEFMLLTGLRRGDMALVGRQHIRDGVLSLRTGKTGAPVTIALPRYLLDIIDATPIAGMHLISQDNGNPYTVESFGNAFRDWCDDAGVEKSAHGLRKLSATLAAEGGAAAHELMAQYGWTKMSMAEIYTKGADRARLGLKNSAIVAGQIENALPRTIIPGAGKKLKKQAKSTA
jgi:integrase